MTSLQSFYLKYYVNLQRYHHREQPGNLSWVRLIQWATNYNWVNDVSLILKTFDKMSKKKMHTVDHRIHLKW